MLLRKVVANDNIVKGSLSGKVMSVSASRARLFKLTYRIILDLTAYSYYVLEYSSSPLISLVSQSSTFQNLRQIYLWECFQVRCRGYCSHPAKRFDHEALTDTINAFCSASTVQYCARIERQT